MSHYKEDVIGTSTPSFLVNKGSIPLDQDTWDKMVEKIKLTHPDGATIVKDMEDEEKNYLSLGFVDKEENIQYSQPVKLHSSMSTLQKLTAIQKYLNKLQYNHTGIQFFNIKKSRSITRLYDTAKEMIKYSLPIKCLEAVVLSLYLTASITTISRFTIRFKTKFGDNIHKHIVLGIYHNSNYGALGLSRRKTLMDKPVIFKTLTDLVLEYQRCYEECFHTLEKVKMSPLLSRDIHSCDSISWNHFTVNVQKLSENEMRLLLERYSRDMRKQVE